MALGSNVQPEATDLMTQKEQVLKARRRQRSIALAVALGLFCLTFYVLTIVKMGPAIFDRAL
ncbi:MAG: hypothetical protein ABS75_18110 [Pelagibacterium sp. SCN 63-23]|nr:MAG: hypothetical protein ABS75_18110 [Pelagibacterium sp. SCN 63-23]